MITNALPRYSFLKCLWNDPNRVITFNIMIILVGYIIRVYVELCTLYCSNSTVRAQKPCAQLTNAQITMCA